jgi:sensor domain CHASE-containing protein
MERNAEKIIMIAALVIAASALLPVVKKTLRVAREELEDIVAEAQFERVKKKFDKEIASLLPEA